MNETTGQSCNTIVEFEQNQRQAYTNKSVQIVFLLNGCAGMLIALILIILIRKRKGHRADLTLLEGCSAGTFLMSCSRVLVSAQRLKQLNEKVKMITSVQCLTLRLDFPLAIVGEYMLHLDMLFLSIERLFYFVGVEKHRRCFSVRNCRYLTLFSMLVAMANMIICYGVVLSKSNYCVPSYCPRTTFMTFTHFIIHLTITILLVTVDIVFYMIALLVHHFRNKVQKLNSLRRMQDAKERTVFHGMVFAWFVIFTMKMIPWISYFVSYFNAEAVDLLVAAQILDNLFMPISSLLYLLIHPDLGRHCKAALARFAFFHSTKNTSVVYIG
ncbi:hypothetical protein T4E_1554 [Trichinella pseudospiralis]|uniref:G-protein coupled receptors family 1 profile domain-containing protein n=1 Tax=Trichinella pseudospiralis TaxID=6337 RepID=A0A0V0Y3M3_TRIPS|nr:hypothetical protein T4E_1554 [Trichinella pseudospiralis]